MSFTPFSLNGFNIPTQSNIFSFQQPVKTNDSEIIYVLFKVINLDRIYIGYFKDGKDVINHFCNTFYDLNTENIKWFEVDKINQNKIVETYILTHQGYVSKSDNRLYNFNITQPTNYVNFMLKLELKKISKDLIETIDKINNKINTSYALSSTKVSDYQNILNNLMNLEKIL